jgi:predicted enzyme related to lactoylglutathione lyase
MSRVLTDPACDTLGECGSNGIVGGPSSASNTQGDLVKITFSSIMVSDQDSALAFYTEILGFIKKQDIPMGSDRWLTVVSPEGPDDVELLLEPMGFAPAKTYQKALFDAGIPLTAFAVPDVQSEYQRLVKRGVVFKTGPTTAGPTTIAVFDDTCGNLIQLYQA